MATIRERLNKGLCNSDILVGGGLGAEMSKGCATLLTSTKILVAIAPNEELKKDADLHAEIDRLLLANKMRILGGVESFEENGSDDAIETAADDTMKVTNQGKYAFLATFSKGLFFNRVMHTMKGFKRWNFMLIDDQGIFGRETRTGLTGFTTGMFNPQKLTMPSTSTSQTESVRFQFLNRYELDEDYGFIMDSSLRKLKGISEIELLYENEPMAGDTAVTVRAVLAMDRGIAYEGASFTDFRLEVNGVARTITAGSDAVTPGVYPLTFSPAFVAGDVVVLGMRVQKGPDGDYYKANGTAYTIPA